MTTNADERHHDKHDEEVSCKSLGGKRFTFMRHDKSAKMKKGSLRSPSSLHVVSSVVVSAGSFSCLSIFYYIAALFFD